MSSVVPFPNVNDPVQAMRLELPSSTEFVGPLMSFLHTLLKNRGIDQTLTTNIVTAIVEAVGNAMMHGNHADAAKMTTILISIGNDSLHVEIQDEGEGFDLESLPDPLAPENIMNLSGRGIFLMKSFMDSVDFEFSGTGTRLMMDKALG